MKARAAALFVGVLLALAATPLALAAAPQRAHLAAYFPGDGVATELVANGTGAPAGDATFVPGQVNDAFGLDGTGDAFEFGGGAWQDPAGDFSVVAWVKTAQATGSQIVIEAYECAGFCPGNDASSMWRLGVDAGKATGIVREGGTAAGATEVVGAAIADGQWHHLGFVRDGAAGKALLYVDGVLSGSLALTSDMDGPLVNADGDVDPIVIGAHIVGGSSSLEQFFSGAIDEVGFYDVALSPEDMAAVADLGRAGLGLTSDASPSFGAATATPGAATPAATEAPTPASANPTAGAEPTTSPTPAGNPAGTGSSDSGPVLVLAGGVVVLLVLGALVWRRRRRSP